MPVLEAMLNTHDITLERPLNSTAGGDSNMKVTHQGLSAVVSDDNQFSRDPGTGVAERVLVTTALFHPYEGDGRLIDVQSGDFIIYPDYREITQRRLVTSVNPVYMLGILDHLVVKAERP